MVSMVARRLFSTSRVFCKAGTSSSSAPFSNPSFTPSGDPHKTFYAKDVDIVRRQDLKEKPKCESEMHFGKLFTDHMLSIDWCKEGGWRRPTISAHEDLRIQPSAKVLHYASALFEGMKAYYGVDGRIRLFRPDMNMARMKRTAIRTGLPDFDSEELIKLISELIRVDKEWVPRSESSSLYIRPTLIGTDGLLKIDHSNEAKLFVIISPSGPYFGSGTAAVSLYADKSDVRAFPGGVGQYKMACNYAPSVAMAEKARKEYGCDQVLWLSGEDEMVTEVGAMNLFMLWTDKEGQLELVTPSLDTGVILPGVTRDSILTLAREMGTMKVSERDFNMRDVRDAVRDKRVHQIFGAGTAAVVSPVGEIVHKNGSQLEKLAIPTLESKETVMQQMYDQIMAIQYGKVDRPGWTREI